MVAKWWRNGGEMVAKISGNDLNHSNWDGDSLLANHITRGHWQISWHHARPHKELINYYLHNYPAVNIEQS
jgi:hypothetical protein